jgi:SOS response regulatory protein OraA/RecX
MKTRTTKSEYARALDLLTRYLALRDHSRHELQQKLSRRFAQETIEKLLVEADANGWLAPEEKIAACAQAAWQRRMKSRRYIEGQLRKRRLPLPPRNDEIELENGRALIERKFGVPQTLSYNDRAKAYRYLKFRGFDERTIAKVFHAES